MPALSLELAAGLTLLVLLPVIYLGWEIPLRQMPRYSPETRMKMLLNNLLHLIVLLIICFLGIFLTGKSLLISESCCVNPNVKLTELRAFAEFGFNAWLE